MFKLARKKDPFQSNVIKPKGKIKKGVVFAFIIILIGSAVTVYAYGKIRTIMRPTMEMVDIPTLKQSVSVYDTISLDDLQLTKYPKGTEDKNYITDINQLDGKIAITPLSAGSPISMTDIGDTYQIQPGEREISLHMDAARSEGAKPGDRVDVYCLSANAAQSGDKAAKKVAEKVADNVLVSDICDDTSGLSINNGTNKSASAAIANSVKTAGVDNSALIYKIIVNDQDVPKVINGSSFKNMDYSFSKHLFQPQP